MIVFLTIGYAALLAILVKIRILPNKAWVWLTTIGWILLLLIVLFFPMQWGAPTGPVRIVTYSVQIIPNVSGVVTEVVASPNLPLKKGDVLFKMDPTPFQAAVDATKAQLEFQKVRLDQYRVLAARQAGNKFRVEETQARVDQLTAELQSAVWNLRESVVRAPSDGHVTYLALRPGQRVTNFPFQPAMTFIEASGNVVGAQIHQIYVRHLRVGQLTEIAFKTRPGQIFTGKVEAILQVASQGQAVIGGTVPAAASVSAEPFFIRIALDDASALKHLPAGSVGTVAIYTDSAPMTHIIRKVMIRMENFLNFLNPAL